MRSFAWALLVGAWLGATPGRETGRIVEVSTADQLMSALHEPVEDVTVRLAPGRYVLTPMAGKADEWDGNEGVRVEPATVGLIVAGKRIRIEGAADGDVILCTTSDYQLYFNDCIDCELERIVIAAPTIEGPNHGAEAAILVRDSNVRISNCVIRGEMSAQFEDGIRGRGSDLVVEFDEIATKGRGIILYDKNRATIRNNVIQGSGPHGAGLLISSSDALVERNHIRRYFRGIDLGDASLTCKANIIEEIQGDGIFAAGHLGRILIERNAIYDCGAAGVVVRADGDQRAMRNLIVETGRRTPRESAIVAVGARADAAIRKNTLYDNTVTDEKLDRDVPREAFWRARRPWTRTYRNTSVGVDGRHKLYESAFLMRYGRWAD